MDMSLTARQGPGKPRVYPDAVLAKYRIAVHPEHLEQLQAAARRRGIGAPALLREIVADWVRENGFEESEAK
jgi:hypothetical protein